MRKKRKNKPYSNIIKIVTFLIILIIIFNVAPNYIITDENIKGKINIVINNENITKKLEHDLFINENDVIYISKEDIKEYFDKEIKYDEKNNQIISTYGEKEVKLPIDKNIVIINEIEVDVLSGATQKEGVYYIPIIEMKKVYEIDVEYIKEEQILLIDSLTKELIKADISKKFDVKYMPTTLSKTIDKVERGSKVVCIERMKNGWTKVRTRNGKIGYVKTKILQNEIYVRENV